MSDPDAIAAFAAQRELGTIERSVSLKTSLAIPGHADAVAHIVQTDRGVWLAAASSEEHGRAFDLTDAELRYHERPIGDQIDLDGQRYGVKIGDGGKVKNALAIGRLKAASQTRRDLGALATAPILPTVNEVERVWLETNLAADEELLAWLETSSKKIIGSRILPGTEVELRYLLTSQRSALVAISPVGDVDLRALRWAPLQVTDSIGRDTVSVGADEWRTTVGSDKLFHQVATIPGLEPAAAIRAAAKLNWLTWTEAGVQEALRLLESSAVPTPPLTRITGLIIEQISRGSDANLDDADLENLREALRGLREQQTSSSRLLVDWLEAWRFPPHEGFALVALALAGEESVELARWALPLHRHVHQRLRQVEKAEDVLIDRDIAFAQHLLWAEELSEAKTLLERLVAELPPQEVADLLPVAADEDLTAGTQQLRVHLLELLARAGDPAIENTRALARSQPLSPDRMTNLVGSSGGVLEWRAQQARELLDIGGLGSEPREPEANRKLVPLSPEQIEILKHPATREGKVLGRLEVWIGKSKVPEFDHLRAHCERVNSESHPAVAAAVRDTCLALSVPTTPAYISRGEKSVGLCAYEGEPAFLLIGSQHLDRGSEFFLRGNELRFAIAAEIAHLRFEHARITVQDFYRGAWDKGGQALSLAAAVLPFVKHVPLEALVGKSGVYRWVRSVVPLSVLERIYQVEDGAELATAVGGNIGPLVDAGVGGIEVAKQTLKTTRERAGALLGRPAPALPDEPEDIGPENTKLVVLCRVLQLTADRAGLVLSDDLVGAIRALFLTSSGNQRELAIALEHGLVACLSRRDDEGKMLFEDLAIRVAALIAFYLSEDYEGLAEALLAG